MSVVAIIFLACAFLMIVVPAASADNSTFTTLGYSFPQHYTNITVVLEKLEVSDFRMGNVYSSTPLDRVQWVRLWYHYENNGDGTENGHLQVKLIDGIGNVYDEPDGTYTGEQTAAHSRSIQKFIEFPIPLDVKITQVKVIQGFNEDLYDVPEASAPTPTVTPTADPSSAATVTPAASMAGSGNCLPLPPFAILSVVGLAGIAAKWQIKK